MAGPFTQIDMKIFPMGAFLMPLLFLGGCNQKPAIDAGGPIHFGDGHRYYIVRQEGSDWSVMDNPAAIERFGNNMGVKGSFTDFLPSEGQRRYAISIYRDGVRVSTAATTEAGKLTLGGAEKYFRPAKHCVASGVRHDIEPLLARRNEIGFFPLDWPQLRTYEQSFRITTPMRVIKLDPSPDQADGGGSATGMQQIERWNTAEQQRWMDRFHQILRAIGANAEVVALGPTVDYPSRVVSVDAEGHITGDVPTTRESASVSFTFEVSAMNADIEALRRAMTRSLDETGFQDPELENKRYLTQLEDQHKVPHGHYRLYATDDVSDHFSVDPAKDITYGFSYLIDEKGGMACL
jgi:hypothetical protein